MRKTKVRAIDPAAEAERQIETASIQLTAWLFPDATGEPMDTDNFRQRVWAPLLKAAKVQPRKLHTLRHTYASLLLQAGKEVHFVSAQLGHADAGFTFRTYGHLIPRDRRGEVSFLDQIPAPICTPAAPNAETPFSPVPQVRETKSAPGVIRTPDLLVRSQPL